MDKNSAQQRRTALYGVCISDSWHVSEESPDSARKYFVSEGTQPEMCPVDDIEIPTFRGYTKIMPHETNTPKISIICDFE